MLNIKHLLKVTVTWISAVYVICFVGVALFPGIRPAFMMYGLHMRGLAIGENVATFVTFFFGLIIWNAVAVLAAWLFAYLFNTIKK